MKLYDKHFSSMDVNPGGQLGTINARFISRSQRVSGDLIRFRNRSKLVEGNLFL